MTLATVFVYVGFISLLIGIGLLAGWPWALVCGGGLMFTSGILSEAREGGKR